MPSSLPWCYTLSPLSPPALSFDRGPYSLSPSFHTYPSFPPYDTASSLFLFSLCPFLCFANSRVFRGLTSSPLCPKKIIRLFDAPCVLARYILFYSYTLGPCACTSRVAHFRLWRMNFDDYNFDMYPRGSSTSFVLLPRGSCNCSLCKVVFIRYKFLGMAFVSMCVIA